MLAFAEFASGVACVLMFGAIIIGAAVALIIKATEKKD